jgi:ligand-binding sensor domain-containing protein
MFATTKTNINLFNKRINRLLLISLYSFISFTASLAQSDLNFEKYSVKDGLSSAVVNSICQDSYGFLWIGTENGLNRFDGYNFKVYKHDPSDSTSIPGDNINSVIEDHEGNIWVAGFEVLAKYDRNTNQFIRFSIEKLYSNPTKIFSRFIWCAVD